MAQAPTYKDGYREGVIKATDVEIYARLGSYGDRPLADILQQIRTRLLSRKITKWINVSRSEPSVSDPANIRYGYGSLYDDRASAESNTWSLNGCIGTFPIEIEEPY